MEITVSPEEVARLVSDASVEVLTEEELLTLINERKVRAYIGIEPSNVLHLGTLVACEPLIRLAKAGFKTIFLLADIHGWLNDKGELDQLQEIAKRNQELLQKLVRAKGVKDSDVEFVYGSSYQLNARYVTELMRLSKLVTASEARKAMDTISKRDVMYKVGSEIYALMQCLDIGYLGINVAVGGMDQRKIHVMAREYLRKLGYTKPVAIHTPIILGLDGKAKMSKSLNNAIFLDDGEKEISEKIYQAFCPEREAENNPLIMLVERVVFPWLGRLEVGGRAYLSFEEFLADWRQGAVTARMLKESLTESLCDILSRISSA
ncbi:MAG: tyrosine--tRNA ligase [Nitrososphaerota archaeon]|nr:tyrosine--tRNA ligase [Candidatus Calditenuaceae archaeon]MDW8072991.1 tyrosine--tRNA ligase [Nitrososphaerota archaeon]